MIYQLESHETFWTHVLLRAGTWNVPSTTGRPFKHNARQAIAPARKHAVPTAYMPVQQKSQIVQNC